MEKYDLPSLIKLVERGLGYRLEIVESAINDLSPALEPITILENFVVVANTSNGDVYRFRYTVEEGAVAFTDPERIEVETNRESINEESKEVVGKIIDALADGDEASVDMYKNRLIRIEREAAILESRLNATGGIKSKYLKNARTAVRHAIASIKGASKIFKGRDNEKLTQLFESGSILIEHEKPKVVNTKTDKRLIHQRIVETRRAAKHLYESPLFVEYATNLYNDVDTEEAINSIAEHYQEVFTLSLSEQARVFSAAIAKNVDNPDMKTVVSKVLEFGTEAMKQGSIRESVEQLTAIIGANETNFHARMQEIEENIGVQVYNRNDLKTINKVLENILTSPSNIFSPEFYNSIRSAKGRVEEMIETGIIDDGEVSAIVATIEQYNPGVFEAAGDGEEYRRFFEKKLKEWGISSPAELTPAEKEDFFKEIEDEWTKEDPSTNDGDAYGDEGRDNEGRIKVDEATGFSPDFIKDVIEG